MNRPQRVGLSFLSTCAAQLLTGAVLCFMDGFALFWEKLFGFLYLSSFLVYPGWLIAIPFVIRYADLRGRHLYRIAAIGFLIGPVVILSVDLALASQNFEVALEWIWKYGALAAIISALSIIFYIIGFKISDRKLGKSTSFTQNEA